MFTKQVYVILVNYSFDSLSFTDSSEQRSLLHFQPLAHVCLCMLSVLRCWHAGSVMGSSYAHSLVRRGLIFLHHIHQNTSLIYYTHVDLIRTTRGLTTRLGPQTLSTHVCQHALVSKPAVFYCLLLISSIEIHDSIKSGIVNQHFREIVQYNLLRAKIFDRQKWILIHNTFFT